MQNVTAEAVDSAAVSSAVQARADKVFKRAAASRATLAAAKANQIKAAVLEEENSEPALSSRTIAAKQREISMKRAAIETKR